MYTICKIILICAASLIGTTSAFGASLNRKSCSTTSISYCADAHRITSTPTFKRSLKVFLGPQASQTINLLHSGILVDQLLEILNGPADKREILPGNSYLFTTCHTKACIEGGSIAFDRTGRIIAVAVVTFHCDNSGNQCSNLPALDLFMNDASPNSVVRQAIMNWASE